MGERGGGGRGGKRVRERDGEVYFWEDVEEGEEEGAEVGEEGELVGVRGRV